MPGPSASIPTVEMAGPSGLRVVNDEPVMIAEFRRRGYKFKDTGREASHLESERQFKMKRRRQQLREEGKLTGDEIEMTVTDEFAPGRQSGESGNLTIEQLEKEADKAIKESDKDIADATADLAGDKKAKKK